MTAAVADILIKKESIRGTASKYNINHNTLFKRVKLAKNLNPSIREADSGNESESENIVSRRCPDKKKYKHRQILSDNEEIELKKYLLRSSQINFGLTYVQTRNLAYQYAKKLGKTYPASWNLNQTAGKDWMLNYMRRHPDLSLRKPENTSLARASAFNKANVDAFFKNYLDVMEKFKFTPSKIFNVDETGITTVLQAPEVIAEKSKRQVGQIVSGERGELVTFCAVINAIGNSLPPIYIFPRVRYKEHFLNGAPSESLGLSSRTGWMTDELFPEVLKHIHIHSNSSKYNRILLLMDNHNTHCTLSAIEYARDNGIVLLSFPPHCSHKLQPLDISIFGPFKTALKVAFNDFMISFPGKLITIYDIPQLTKRAYENSFTPGNILTAFQKPGIWPVNRFAFNDEDFSASYVTDQPLNIVVENESIDVQHDQHQHELPSFSSQVNISIQNNCQLQLPSTSRQANIISIPTPEHIKPFPKAPARTKKLNGRQKGKSRIFTDTPEKNRVALLKKIKTEKNDIQKNLIKKKQTKQNRKQRKVSETSESDTSVQNLPESDDCSIISLQNENYPRTLCDDDVIKVDDFVLVKFSQLKKNDVFYIGQIQKIFGHTEFDVKYLRKHNQYYVFPLIDDISLINRSDIVFKLDEPSKIPGTVRTQSCLRFNVDEYNYYIR